MKIFCENCEKSRETSVTQIEREDTIWLKSYCPICGKFWCKKKATSTGYREDREEEWFKNYKYNIKNEEWKGVRSDGKISSN